MTMSEATKLKISDGMKAKAEARRNSQPESEDPKPIDSFVTTADFNKFANDMMSVVTKLTETVKAVAEKKPVDLELKEAEPDREHIDPKWRLVVDKTLGIDFGLRVSYPESGSGLIFKIVIPREKSNATEEHWKLYKSDIRSKASQFSDALTELELWCKKIKNNLALDRRNIIK